MPTYIRRRSSCRPAGVVADLRCARRRRQEGQHALGHAHQHHVRPLQPLEACSVRASPRSGPSRARTGWTAAQSSAATSSRLLVSICVVAPAVVVDLAAAALRHPVAELQHVGPAGGGHLSLSRRRRGAFRSRSPSAIRSEGARAPRPLGLARAVFQVVHIAGRTRAGCPWPRRGRVAQHGENSAANRLVCICWPKAPSC